MLLVAYLMLFFYAYVLVMGFYRAHLAGKLKGLAKLLAIPVLAIGWCMDLFSNWTIATFLFLELPESPLELVTDRMRRYIESDTGWRAQRATWLCHSLLDMFDPNGSHCTTGTKQ
jgi:hypothetical protein